MVCSSRPTVADGMREVRSSGCRSCRAPPHVSTHWARTADAFRRPLSEMVGSRRLMLVANPKPRSGAGRRPRRHASSFELYATITTMQYVPRGRGLQLMWQPKNPPPRVVPGLAPVSSF
jgi:hypothetical protein